MAIAILLNTSISIKINVSQIIQKDPPCFFFFPHEETACGEGLSHFRSDAHLSREESTIRAVGVAESALEGKIERVLARELEQRQHGVP